MLKKIMLFSALTLTAAHALAIPDVAGDYNCNISIQSDESSKTVQAPVSFIVANNTIELKGFDAEATNKGLPCSNDSQKVSQGGAKIRATSTCNDQKLSLDLRAKYSPERMDLRTVVTIEKKSADQAQFTIQVAGKNQGLRINANVVGVCVRK